MDLASFSEDPVVLPSMDLDSFSEAPVTLPSLDLNDLTSSDSSTSLLSHLRVLPERDLSYPLPPYYTQDYMSNVSIPVYPIPVPVPLPVIELSESNLENIEECSD